VDTISPMSDLAGVFGRTSDADAVVAALRSSGRCVVVGAGGIGKSTIARAVAQRFGAPVAWVDAEPLEHLDAVLRAMLDAMAVTVLPGDRPADLVAGSMADARSLIVIDGAERFAPDLAELTGGWTTGAEGPWLLVTSRVPLGPRLVPVVRLAPLAGDAARPEDSDAGAMMCACVAALGGDASALTASPDRFASLLASTGGLPLAIELVSTRIARFGLEFVAGRPQMYDDVIERCLDRTLDLLDAGDVTLFRRLGVTGGPISMTLLAGIADEPGDASQDAVVARVGRLVDHGLVQSIGGSFDLLPPVRDVARRQLRAVGEYESVLQAAVRWAYIAAGGADRRHDPTSVRVVHADLDAFLHLAWAAVAEGLRSAALDLVDVLFVPLGDRLRNHDSLALLEEALGIEGDTDIDPEREAASAVRAAICASECDTVAHAERWLDRADRAASRMREPNAVSSHIASIRAFVALDEGRLAAAEEHGEHSVELARRAGESFIVHQSLRCIALSALARGDLDRAELLCAEVLGWGRQHDLYTELNARVAISWCLLERGRRAEAAEQARLVHHEVAALDGYAREVGLESELVLLAALPPDRDLAGPEVHDPTASWSVRLEQRLRRAAGATLRARPESVIQTATDVAVLAGLVPHARIRVEANLLLGDAALVMGDLRQALLAYEQALRDAIRGAFRLRCADALDGLAAVAAANGVDGGTVTAGALAASVRDRCGAMAWRHGDAVSSVAAAPGRGRDTDRAHPGHWWHDGTPTKECADELVSMLRASPPAAGTPIELLTRAERQVAELVAAGLANSEIAASLFISRRTVETHLTHIFRKLDLRTRTQLATLQLRPG